MLSKSETLTGISSLDSLFGNCAKGALIFIVGRLAVGKTALALQIAKHQMDCSEKKTIFFSLEEGQKQLMWRPEKASNGPLPANDNIIIDDNCLLSVPEMQAICEKIDGLGTVALRWNPETASFEEDVK